MAETKQKKSKPKPKSKKTQAKRRSASPASKAKSKAGKASSSANGGGASAAVDSAKNGAGNMVNGVTPIIQKVKLPLLAGGAAAAGVAGAVLASRSGHKQRKVLGVSVPKRSKLSLPKRNGLKPDARKVSRAVADAARRADNIGQGVSKIASSVQKVGESAEDAVKKS